MRRSDSGYQYSAVQCSAVQHVPPPPPLPARKNSLFRILFRYEASTYECVREKHGHGLITRSI